MCFSWLVWSRVKCCLCSVPAVCLHVCKEGIRGEDPGHPGPAEKAVSVRLLMCFITCATAECFCWCAAYPPDVVCLCALNASCSTVFMSYNEDSGNQFHLLISLVDTGCIRTTVPVFSATTSKI